MCRILLTHVAYSYFCASHQQLSSRLVRPLTQIQPSIDFSCNPVSHNCIPFYRLEASSSFHSIASRIVSLCSLRKWSFSRMLFQEETIYFLKEKLWFGFSLITSVFISLKENHFQGLLFQEERIYNLYVFIDQEYLYFFKRKSRDIFEDFKRKNQSQSLFN